MRILIVYHQVRTSDRNTIDEHLYSFGRFSGEECHYLNVHFGVPSYLAKIPFDLVLYHYTFTSLKWEGVQRFRGYLNRCAALKRCSGYKAAIPQDEYVHSLSMCSFFAEFGIKTVFTCLSAVDHEKVYPRELTGIEHYLTVFTGYIDEESAKEVTPLCRPHHERALDVGYRARRLPFWLGRHGLVKWQLTERISDACRNSGLRTDLSNEPEEVFVGKAWYRFLGSCRVVLGCEGGASLHDPEGAIRACVEDYVSRHPEASFEEVEMSCFPGLDGNLHLNALSPRHFEACITKTCQALVEGEYAGIFKPGIHYIEIKKDWSNLDEVLESIQDVTLCERIAEQAYADIVLSGRYTYRVFIRDLLDHVRTVHPCSGTATSCDGALYLLLLDMRERFPFIFSPLKSIWSRFIYTRLFARMIEGFYAFLKKRDLEDEYKAIRRTHVGFSVKFMGEAYRFIIKVLKKAIW